MVYVRNIHALVQGFSLSTLTVYLPFPGLVQNTQTWRMVPRIYFHVRFGSVYVILFFPTTVRTYWNSRNGIKYCYFTMCTLG